MAILHGSVTTRKDSEEDVVYSEDPDVVVPDELRGCGWVPVDLCQTKPGADVVRHGGVGAAKKTAARDLWQRFGEARMNHFLAEAAVTRVNKERQADKIKKWIDTLAMQNPMALDLLGRRIDLVTMGLDPAAGHKFARAALGYPEPAPKEVADEGEGSKSGG